MLWLNLIAAFSSAVNVVSASNSSACFVEYINSNPSGISSVISEAKPSMSPSL